MPPISNRMKVIDIRMCLLITEQNHSAISVEHYVKFFKSSYKLLNPLSDDLKLTCGRTKCTKIIQNVIGKEGEMRVVEKMRKQDFSILIDESTDVSTDQHLSVVVRTLDDGDLSLLQYMMSILFYFPSWIKALKVYTNP